MVPLSRTNWQYCHYSRLLARDRQTPPLVTLSSASILDLQLLAAGMHPSTTGRCSKLPRQRGARQQQRTRSM